MSEDVARRLGTWFGRTRAGMPRDPERMRDLLDACGIPDPPRVVHIVGTNGKGSVAARIAAGLSASGLRTLRYLSPHVERFHERIAVDGVEIDDGSLIEGIKILERNPSSHQAAFFELTTALALWHAERQHVDIAVIEAGVGAKYDATSVIGNVDLAVLTNVGEDHLATLGPTLLDVARDKSAVIRPDTPFVTGADGEALDLLMEKALRLQAPLLHAPPIVGESGVNYGIEQQHAEIAAHAITCLVREQLREVAHQAARERPMLPARREVFRGGDDQVIVLDGAHNPPALSCFLRELSADTHLLVGMAARKDTGATKALFERFERVTLTVAVAGETPFGEERTINDPIVALRSALADLPPGGTLAVTGSFYLAGAVRPWLRAWATSSA